ncbi:MAG: hypothetical protein ACE5IG_00030 [Dehalococcoidia bacterium]
MTEPVLLSWNGEFHSFVYDGPIFKEQVEHRVGEVVLRDGFYFCDLTAGWEKKEVPDGATPLPA